MSDEEAGWHAEADRVFAGLIVEARENPPGRRSRAENELEVDAADWLVGIALRCEDREYVEGWCIRLARELPPGHHMLGLAGLCLGHAARRFRCLNDEARAVVEELSARCRANPDDVDGRALNGLEDVDQFAPRHPRLAKIKRLAISLWYRVR